MRFGACVRAPDRPSVVTRFNPDVKKRNRKKKSDTVEEKIFKKGGKFEYETIPLQITRLSVDRGQIMTACVRRGFVLEKYVTAG